MGTAEYMFNCYSMLHCPNIHLLWCVYVLYIFLRIMFNKGAMFMPHFICLVTMYVVKH